ncbi:MAG: FkbM family methyltransferase [Actinomycetota bacterium]
MGDGRSRLARSLVSYLPSEGLITLRRLRALPAAIARRPHEDDFLAFRDFRRPNPVIVDVGANRGQSVMSFHRTIGTAQIHCFEPNPFLHGELQRFGVEINGVALGARDGEIDLYVPRYGHTLYDTRAALDEATAANFLSDTHFAGFRPGRAGVEHLTVAITTLDSFALAPDIIKIDVEGGGADVIAGARHTIAAHRPLLMFEDDAGESAALVADLGYELARFDPGARSLVKGQAGDPNSFLVHPHHVGLLAVHVV